MDAPENTTATEVGSIHIALVLNENGIGISYELDDITKEAAIGYLLVVSDRLREGVASVWRDEDEDEEEDDESFWDPGDDDLGV